ncbi:hypothetical protein HELRODRAFT_173064 [Helobdella robusta]|uniref:K Homology domain-containing protein n=1 Tax=Helobdella robusta TaxID=6412 RepID=T1F6B2_HELRO|nr:hypothetical protein HELRODRAFT_173064 [Helobdella robusta]ESO04008.1 hypothetical protein HELRODRAFT_173064 [Helobdella robusta]
MGGSLSRIILHSENSVNTCDDPTYKEQFLGTCASDIINNYPLLFNADRSRMVEKTDEKRCFILPLHLLKLVMGDRGDRMLQISKESNSQIEVRLMNDKPHECIVVITGSPKEASNARHLISMWRSKSSADVAYLSIFMHKTVNHGCG